MSVQENTPAGENIGNPIDATDAADSSMKYSLSGTDATEFAIVDTTGQIQTSTVFDYETDSTSYTIIVEAHASKDPKGNENTVADDTITVTINVTDMDIPAVPAKPTVVATPGVAASLTVTWTAVTATETAPVQGYEVRYREKNAQTPNAWNDANVDIAGTSYTITGSGIDNGKTYEVQVRSKNGEGESEWSPIGEGTSLKRLNVIFSPATRSVSEGGSVTYTVTVSPATDRALSIPITSSRNSAETGDYSVSGIPLSFASGDTSQTFTVSTTKDSDRDDESLTLGFGTLPAAVGTGSQSTATLTITDTTPAQRSTERTFHATLSPTRRTVNEGSSGTFTVILSPAADAPLRIPVVISSTDAESGDYSPTSTPLNFESGDTYKNFVITAEYDADRDDETLSIGFGTLPAAVRTAYLATATMTIIDTTPRRLSNTGGGGGQGGGSSARSNSGGGGGYRGYSGRSSYQTRNSVPSYVPPANRVPSFTEGGSTHRSVVENSAALVSIGSPVTATDRDNDTLTYEIGGMDGASFAIDASTGQLLSSSVLDFEVQQSYSILVRVSDGNGGTDRINVLIFVIDVDETPPPVPVAQRAVPTPEPAPAASPTPEPTEAPTPTPTAIPVPSRMPDPAPTAIPAAVPTPKEAETPTGQPTPTSAPPPELPGERHQQRVAPPEIVDLGNATQPGVGHTTVAIIPDDLRKFRIWPIILIALGIILELISLGVFIRQHEVDKRKIWAGH